MGEGTSQFSRICQLRSDVLLHCSQNSASVGKLLSRGDPWFRVLWSVDMNCYRPQSHSGPQDRSSRRGTYTTGQSWPSKSNGSIMNVPPIATSATSTPSCRAEKACRRSMPAVKLLNGTGLPSICWDRAWIVYSGRVGRIPWSWEASVR